jgi:hypothetical protein
MTSCTPAVPMPVVPPVLDAAAKRDRRRRTLYVLASISIGWKVLVFTVGAAVPRWLIDDGVARLPGDLRPYARQAKQTAATLWNGPIERYGMVRALRVVSVERAAGGLAGERCGGLGARVRAYTYFGVPYSEATTVCDRGVVEYRVFRPRQAAAR